MSQSINSFVTVLRSTVNGLGLHSASFSGHSFRWGGTTSAFRAQVPGEIIQLEGDWASDAYLKYCDMGLMPPSCWWVLN